MRQSMEQMMYDNGVDIVLNGHLHEYERTKSVYVSPFCPINNKNSDYDCISHPHTFQSVCLVTACNQHIQLGNWHAGPEFHAVPSTVCE